MGIVQNLNQTYLCSVIINNPEKLIAQYNLESGDLIKLLKRKNHHYVMVFLCLLISLITNG